MNKKIIFVNKIEHDGFIQNALTLKGSVTPRVIKNVMFVFFYSCIISVINFYEPSVFLPIGPFEYAGLIMGLILVFRLNAGYDRWWEARKIWGTIVNQSRNFAIIISNYISDDASEEKSSVLNYIAAIPYLIKNNLRNEDSFEDAKHLFEKDDTGQLIISENKPLILASMIANKLTNLRHTNQMDSFAFLKAEEARALILDCHGACERILKTPIPYVMAIKVKRFILLFLIPLPFATVSSSLYLTPFITGIVAYALFSVDQIGLELQNPFSQNSLSHLPLDTICNTIEKNIMDIHKNHQLVDLT